MYLSTSRISEPLFSQVAITRRAEVGLILEVMDAEVNLSI